MKHITIRNFGPLKYADVELKDINVIIGPQSSGKSCLLKTASYCTWVEKRIQLSQSPMRFAEKGYFIHRLTTFHKLEGYVKPETVIVYETESMKFSYTHADGKFTFEWKEDRWNYQSPKVAYIPAERNMVAAIPNWFEVKMGDDNIRSFMSDWQKARMLQERDLPILNLGVSYHYNARSNSDKIVMDGGRTLDFTNTSSGLQSLIPLYVYIDYLTRKRFETEEEASVQRQNEYDNLLQTVYNQLFVEKGLTTSQPLGMSRTEEGKISVSAQLCIINIGNFMLHFKNSEYAEECKRIYDGFTQMASNEIFIEEPEQNLFPPTQSLLISNLIDTLDGARKSRLFVATHSPYVVTALMEQRGEHSFALLVVAEDEEEGTFSAQEVSEEDVQQAYDYSIDLFHNINHLGA